MIHGKELLRGGQFWQNESHDRIVRNQAELIRMRSYIEKNPAKLRAGTYSFKQMTWLDEFV